MIDVKIIENNGLVALCTISGSRKEFDADLARVKRIPYADREFVNDVSPAYWRVHNPERYAMLIVEIGDAVRLHKSQLRFL